MRNQPVGERRPLIFSGTLVALALALALASAGCSSDGGTAAPVTVTVTQSTASEEAVAEGSTSTKARPRRVALTEFSGEYFTIRYPRNWIIDTAEVDKGAYLDTTVSSHRHSGQALRVDVTLATDQTAYEHAVEVRGYLVDQPGYEELAFSSETYQGYDAVRWEFLVEEDGVVLRKSDTFFTSDEGHGFAVLVQAPASQYGRLARTFRRLASSFQTAEIDSAPSGTNSQPADFCSANDCIDNFYNGVGYIVQCADGMWSHSGGRSGACSWHGGETSTTLDDGGSGDYAYDGDGSGVDLGPGNGYTVVCSDGSISHSGGISGACSHHGGVSGN